MQPIKLYTIYTEAVNISQIRVILGKYFDSYTIIPAQGIWKGGNEDSLVIQIMTLDAGGVHFAANEIKIHNKQSSVLVIGQDVIHALI